MKNALLPALILITLVGCSSSNNYQLAGFKRQDDGTIAFDLRKGDQRIRAICSTNQSECANLALKAGNSVDCYMHASGDFVPDATFTPDPSAGAVKIDAYGESGLVCHAADGHGRLFIMRSQECVEMKEVALNLVRGRFMLPILSKPFFQAPRDEQIKYLKLTDPDFAKASPTDQAAYLDYLLKGQSGDIFDRISPTTPPNQMHAPRGGSTRSGILIVPDPDTWSAFVPVVFDDSQINGFIRELNVGTDGFTQYRVKTALLPSAYQGYTASAVNPLHFCKLADRRVNERGKDVQNDTVLLTVLESNVEKH